MKPEPSREMILPAGPDAAVEQLRNRCRQLSGLAADAACDADALVGMLQQFRPSGAGLERLFEGLPMGDALQQRLSQLYQVAGDATRPGGGLDAYFIVRKPAAMDPQWAERCAAQWVQAVVELARETEHEELVQRLDPPPRIRVLQGVAPKQMRADLQTFPLYRALKVQAAELTQRLPANHAALELLRPAYYFAACDWALRDYLLWPAYAPQSRADDPFGPYFELWRHGAKVRILADDRIDIYLPYVE